jgi:acyl dehydratase
MSTHAHTHLASRHEIESLIKQPLVPSDWLTIDQNKVNLFAQATDDHQWIHVDPDRAHRESPFGAPIAHGFLTLSLIARFLEQAVSCEGVRLAINYGLNKARFITPVTVGSRVRALITLRACEPVGEDAVQLTWDVKIEIEGKDKPACVAESLIRWYFEPPLERAHRD